MDWDMIKVICIIIGIQSGLLVAAAKSIFVTQIKHDLSVIALTHKLYDENGIPLYLIKTDWEKSKNERERRHDTAQRKLCEQMQSIQKAQNNLNTSVNVLISRFDRKYEKKITP